MLYFKHLFKPAEADNKLTVQKIYKSEKPSRKRVIEYLAWVKTMLKENDPQREQCQWVFDKVAFMLGKQIKNKKAQP